MNVLAYRIRWSSYLLWLCLRCGHTYTGEREEIVLLPALPTRCDKCHVVIPRGTEES